MQLTYLLALLPCVLALPTPHGSASITRRGSSSSASCSAGNFKCDTSSNSISVCIAGTTVTTATVPAGVCSLLSSLGSQFGSAFGSGTGSFASATSFSEDAKEEGIRGVSEAE